MAEVSRANYDAVVKRIQADESRCCALTIAELSDADRRDPDSCVEQYLETVRRNLAELKEADEFDAAADGRDVKAEDTNVGTFRVGFRGADQTAIALRLIAAAARLAPIHGLVAADLGSAVNRDDTQGQDGSKPIRALFLRCYLAEDYDAYGSGAATAGEFPLDWPADLRVRTGSPRGIPASVREFLDTLRG